MQNRPEKPKRLKALADPPLFHCKPPSLRIGPQQSRERSEAKPIPLTARTDPRSFGEKARGHPRHFDFVWFPSLPAGINTDDSDPLFFPRSAQRGR